MTSDQVRERFDGETGDWIAIHQNASRDLVSYEVARRKRFALNIIKSQFNGRTASILEIGCGAGRNLADIIANEPLWTGTGVDISPAMIDLCRNEYASNERLRFGLLNLESDCLPEQFDVIILLGVVGYFTYNQIAFQNVAKMLKPGGLVIFTFGRVFSLPRAFRRLRSNFSAALRPFRHWIRGRDCQKGKPCTGSGFKCYSWRSLQRAFPVDLRCFKRRHIVFGIPCKGRCLTLGNRFAEKLFSRFDPFRIAFTSCAVLTQDPTNSTGGTAGAR